MKKQTMKKIKLIAILTVATVAVGGAAWLSTQAGTPVGEGKHVHMLANPS